MKEVNRLIDLFFSQIGGSVWLPFDYIYIKFKMSGNFFQKRGIQAKKIVLKYSRKFSPRAQQGEKYEQDLHRKDQGCLPA